MEKSKTLSLKHGGYFAHHRNIQECFLYCVKTKTSPEDLDLDFAPNA